MQLIYPRPRHLLADLRLQLNPASQSLAGPPQAFVPAIDIHTEPERYVVRADLPGVDPAEIEITVTGDRLTLKGERRLPPATDGSVQQHAERGSGSFERRLRLPEEAASDAIEASFSQGVLTVTIPRKRKPAPYRIEVTQH